MLKYTSMYSHMQVKHNITKTREERKVQLLQLIRAVPVPRLSTICSPLFPVQSSLSQVSKLLTFMNGIPDLSATM